MKFQTPDGGCMWPHHVDSPICVYDRESYEKYKSGEYKLPKHCICGAELSYDKPHSIVLVEDGQMNGEMLLTVEVPPHQLNISLTLDDDVQKIKAEEDFKDQALKKALDGVEVKASGAWEKAGESFGERIQGLGSVFKTKPLTREEVEEEREKMLAEPLTARDPDIDRITVKCKHSGQTLLCCASSNGIVYWECPCGFRYEKALTELGLLDDVIEIDEHCRWAPRHRDGQ